jgi:uncharacterized membrane protein YbhN (UPF0104 family)
LATFFFVGGSGHGKNSTMWRLISKFVVSIIVFAVVLSRIDIGAVGHAVAGASGFFLIVALLLLLSMIVTDAAFWRSVLDSLGHRISFGTAILYSFSGSFFGGLGLSWTGVDIFRAAQLRQSGISTGTAVRAVVTTRLMSFVSLLAVIGFGLPVVFRYPLQPLDKLSLVALVMIGVGGIVSIIMLAPMQSYIRFLGSFAVLERVAGISTDFGRALSSGGHSAVTLLFATSTHLLRVSTFAAIAAALHAGTNFAAIYALVPTALLVAMVPISLGSWGVREASMIFFLGWAGVSATMALSISVTFGILNVIVDALGGIAWTFARPHHFEVLAIDGSNRVTQAPTEHGEPAVQS